MNLKTLLILCSLAVGVLIGNIASAHQRQRRRSVPAIPAPCEPSVTRIDMIYDPILEAAESDTYIACGSSGIYCKWTIVHMLQRYNPATRLWDTVDVSCFPYNRNCGEHAVVQLDEHLAGEPSGTYEHSVAVWLGALCPPTGQPIAWDSEVFDY
jgi:hypothetical protein